MTNTIELLANPQPQPPLGPRYYFAYGSNLSTTQMMQRCPGSAVVGVAVLDGWGWFTNERGFANVADGPDRPPLPRASQLTAPMTVDFEIVPGQPRVYGLVYTITAEDEAMLDVYEGVPSDVYRREMVPMRFYPTATYKYISGPLTEAHFSAPSAPEVVSGGQVCDVLVYVDRLRITHSPPRREYVTRLRRGIAESSLLGVPMDWLRRTIEPVLEESEV